MHDENGVIELGKSRAASRILLPAFHRPKRKGFANKSSKLHECDAPNNEPALSDYLPDKAGVLAPDR
jgi:hypothetical protein